MTGLAIITIYILTVGIAYKAYKAYRSAKPKSRSGRIDLLRFDQEMNDLIQQRDKMMSLYHLLTDIDICEKEREAYKVFEIRWINEATSETMSYDVFIFDREDASAAALIQLANVELDVMAPQLEADVERLKFRSRVRESEIDEIARSFDRFTI